MSERIDLQTVNAIFREKLAAKSNEAFGFHCGLRALDYQSNCPNFSRGYNLGEIVRVKKEKKAEPLDKPLRYSLSRADLDRPRILKLL